MSADACRGERGWEKGEEEEERSRLCRRGTGAQHGGGGREGAGAAFSADDPFSPSPPPHLLHVPAAGADVGEHCTQDGGVLFHKL